MVIKLCKRQEYTLRLTVSVLGSTVGDEPWQSLTSFLESTVDFSSPSQNFLLQEHILKQGRKQGRVAELKAEEYKEISYLPSRTSRSHQKPNLLFIDQRLSPVKQSQSIKEIYHNVLPEL